MIVNLFLFIVLELASGFCNSLRPFLAVRALYGISMGVSYAVKIYYRSLTDIHRVSLVLQ
jgi:hypothetical protein